MEKYEGLAKAFNDDLQQSTKKYDKLRDLDLFVLDNSIRESTVGQLRGHTIENKWKIYEEVKKCGFGNYIVASFNHMTRVDDVFIRQLVERGEDRNQLWAFSEITEGAKKRVPDMDTVPTGLRKLKDVGLYNVIFEVDFGDAVYDFTKITVEDICKLMEKWILWCHDNLHEEAKVFVNFRDIPDFIVQNGDRMFQTIDFLANLPPRIRPFGLLFEEPSGKSLPEEVGLWAKFMRKAMDDNNWKGHLLVHVHEKFQMCETTALESLMNGADGIWASVIIEGAAMGNASSCVTLMNMIRLGNKKVLEKYNCANLRQAANNVTLHTTGNKPYIKQPVYGERALDLVLGMTKDEFDMASFFGEHAPVRMTTLASPEMIKTRLVNVFGDDSQFNLDIAYKMKEVMLDDLRKNRKEEYMSKVGLAILFDRAGGSLTETMRDVIVNEETNKPHFTRILAEIRERWDEWDLKDAVQGDDMLQFDSFYNGFMAPYFSCYRCSDTKKALRALDMDSDDHIDWSEFKVYLMWAMHQYPNCKDADEVIDIAFRKGLIPAMRDELLDQQQCEIGQQKA